jgi:hypothetical protein
MTQSTQISARDSGEQSDFFMHIPSYINQHASGRTPWPDCSVHFSRADGLEADVIFFCLLCT